jgi:hypothetical protein
LTCQSIQNAPIAVGLNLAWTYTNVQIVDELLVIMMEFLVLEQQAVGMTIQNVQTANRSVQ